MDSQGGTLDITILQPGDAKSAVAIARFGSDTAIEPLSCDTLDELTKFRTRIGLAISGDSAQRPNSAELATFGQNLFRFAVRDSLERVYGRLPATHVRMHIFSNRPEIQGLPWEYAQNPGDVAPSAMRSIVRIVPTIGVEAPKPSRLSKGVRVLLVAADPIDQPGVGWEDVKLTLQRVFGVRLGTDKLQIDIVEGANLASLNNALLAKSYDVLHFSGHGEIDAKGQGRLMFKHKQNGRSQAIDAESLCKLVRGRELRLVVLGACESGAGDFSTPFGVVARALVERGGIPAVVANQFPLPIETVATFATAMYAQLLASGDIDLALVEGRRALAVELQESNAGASLEWGIPVLYRHVNAYKVFEA